jgi:hypothetical protein
MLMLGTAAEPQQKSRRCTDLPRRREPFLPQTRLMLVDLHVIEVHAEPLALHVHGRTDILVDVSGGTGNFSPNTSSRSVLRMKRSR